MARAAYEQVVQLVDCHYDPDPQPDVDESEEVLSDEAGADEHSDADVQVQTPEGAAVFRMLMGDNDKQQHRACLEHFQIALNMLMINTPTGPQTVFPDGTKLPPHTQQSDGNGTGQYL